ncbi:Cytochrome b5-like heme/steroid binding domain [Dillenia turbinata]|uniref:Cytochrome b5-like heme/steroid binding domain n=1 Tax=Dillenia turbinata TaxID=194707 RepID=A0AAN8Z9B4_9MAGN
MGLGLYYTFMEAITNYTGLTPTAFFTILAIMVVAYKMVCGLFVSPEDYYRSLPNNGVNPNIVSDQSFQIAEPVQLGDVTEEELRAYDGSDPCKPLLMAIKGQIYDVSRSRMFYGPGGPYAMFSGRDASRALALLSFDPQDRTGNIEGLTDSELEVLQDWEYKFKEKYVKVGQLVTKKIRNEGNESEERTETQDHGGNGDAR